MFESKIPGPAPTKDGMHMLGLLIPCVREMIEESQIPKEEAMRVLRDWLGADCNDPKVAAELRLLEDTSEDEFYGTLGVVGLAAWGRSKEV